MKEIIKTEKKFLRPYTFERLIRQEKGKCKRKQIKLCEFKEKLVFFYQPKPEEPALIAFIGEENIYSLDKGETATPIIGYSAITLNLQTSTGHKEKIQIIIHPGKGFKVKAVKFSSAEFNIEYAKGKHPKSWRSLEIDVLSSMMAVEAFMAHEKNKD